MFSQHPEARHRRRRTRRAGLAARLPGPRRLHLRASARARERRRDRVLLSRAARYVRHRVDGLGNGPGFSTDGADRAR